MLRLLFLSSISVSLLAAGCGDDDCGPGNAPETGLTAGNADVQFVFGGLSSGTNNDCPDTAAPAGVISLTITGTRADGGAGLLTLCVPRPDLLSSGVPLGNSGVRVIDLNAEVDNDCGYSFDSSRPTTGTAKATGLCDAGADKAGFALTIDGAMSLAYKCGTPRMPVSTIAVTFAGNVAVAVP